MAVGSAAEIPLGQIYEKLRQQDPEWLETTLRQRWQTLTVGDQPDATALAPTEQATSTRRMSLGLYDVTGQDFPPGRLSDHLIRFRSHDWASTDVGPMSSWSSELRRMVNLCMADPRPVALWWGRKTRIALYNDAYRSFLQERDAWALGKSVSEVWHDVPSFPQNFSTIDTTGDPASGEDTLFFVRQVNGRFEELWTSWAIMPVLGAMGNIGYYNSCSLNTQQVIYERRMSTLLALERHTSSVGTVNDFWSTTIHGLKANSADVPFAALYSADPSGERLFSAQDRDIIDSNGRRYSDNISYSDSSSSASGEISLSQWTLRGVLESRPGQLQLSQTMDFEMALETFGQLIKTAIETRLPQLLRFTDGTFPEPLQSKAISRAYGDLCHEAIIIPVPHGHRQVTAAFLVLGINSRKSYDEDYQKFISMLRHQLATSLNSIIMVEDEARHVKLSAELAARDRMQLTEKLNLSEQDARDKEMRFRSMADQAPIPMFECTTEGELLYVNESWHVLTGHPRDNFDALSWVDICHPDDRVLFSTNWARLTSGESVNFEMRLSKPYISDEYIAGQRLQGETWISTFGYAEKHPDGNVSKVLGSVVDISHYKWMQTFQERRTADALELKRQQEAFMDMTSHEARNPLAAISLCVESIISTFRNILGNSGEQVAVRRNTIESSLDSAETIMACVAHQKCIIDDVLTLSKIDSGLLLVSPVEIQPVEEVRRALRLFDGELQQAAIDLHYDVGQSYQDLQVDWVLLDPTRLLQILINLLTNAIKFTKDEPKRRIIVTLSANRNRPTNNDGVMFMSSTDSNGNDVLSEPGDETLYLSFKVEDTGRGIEHADLEHLFQRFQQGSRRTHVKYGGSGLGLFICKELARLQGGQIGVSAARGKGSTFTFFVRATRCSPPAKNGVHVRGDHSLPLRGSTAAPGAESAKPRIQHVLLVEDNLVNQKVMAKQLRTAGYTVTVANHGQEALDHLLTTQFCKSNGGSELDIVLMDIEMPVMDGLKCSKRVRDMEISGEVKGKLPMIAVTANARAEQQAQAMKAGFDAVITKPFRMGELVLEMERICGG